MTTIRLQLATLALVMLVACGDDSSGGGGSGGSGGAGGTGGNGGQVTDGGGGGGGGPPDESCIRPGDVGNALGVGEYCEPFGGQCADNSDAQLCLADVGQDQWMCTRISCEEADCGEGAGCLITEDGSACVPCKCDDTGVGCPGAAGGAGPGGGNQGGAGG